MIRFASLTAYTSSAALAPILGIGRIRLMALCLFVAVSASAGSHQHNPAGQHAPPNLEGRTAASVNLGKTFMRSGRRRTALRAFEAALNLEPHNSEAERLVHAVRTDGEEEVAFEQLQNRLHIDPSNPNLHTSLAEALLDRLRYADAKAEANRAIEIDATQWHAYSVLGRIAVHAKDWTEAQVNLAIATSHDPSDSITACALGDFEVDAKDMKAAIHWYHRAVDLVPNDPGAHRKLAQALELNGLNDAARRERLVGMDLLRSSKGRPWTLTGLSRPIPSDSSNDVATAMAIDPKGNLIVTGFSMSSNRKTGYDFLTAKLDANGRVLWRRRTDGGPHLDDKPTALATDSAGNIFVAGMSMAPITDSDFLILKYSPDGKLLWARRWNGKANGYDEPTAIAIDVSENVIVTGFSLAGLTGYAMIALKLTTNGDLAWVSQYRRPHTLDDFGCAVRIDRTGSVIVAGLSRLSKTATLVDLVKYHADGSEAWAKAFAGDPWEQTAMPKFGFLNNGLFGAIRGARTKSIFATFSTVAPRFLTQASHSGDGPDHIRVSHLNEHGRSVWSRTYASPTHDVDEPVGCIANSKSDVFVVGSSWSGAAKGFDYVALKYTAKGRLQWVRRLNGDR